MYRNNWIDSRGIQGAPLPRTRIKKEHLCQELGLEPLNDRFRFPKYLNKYMKSRYTLN